MMVCAHCVDTQACLTAEEARAKDAREGRQFNPVQFVEPMSAGVSLERHDVNMQALDTDEFEMDAEGNADDHLIDLGDDPEFDVDADLLMDLDDTVLIDEVAEEVF